MPVVDVIVAPNGQIKIETRGYAGATCRDATRTLEAVLGLVQIEQLTAEFHQSSAPETLLLLLSDAAD